MKFKNSCITKRLTTFTSLKMKILKSENFRLREKKLKKGPHKMILTI